jgi:hypothetical protein
MENIQAAKLKNGYSMKELFDLAYENWPKEKETSTIFAYKIALFIGFENPTHEDNCKELINLYQKIKQINND